MRVGGTKQDEVEITIDDREISRIVTSGLDLNVTMRGVWQSFLQRQNLNADTHLDKQNRWAYTYEVRGGSHGWDDTEIQRDATPSELAFYNTFQQLKEAQTLITLDSDSVRD